MSSHRSLLPMESVSECMKTRSMVEIRVGSQKDLWILNEELIYGQSPFFKSTFKGNFKEGQEKSMHLESDDLGLFAKVVDWMHTLRFDCVDKVTTRTVRSKATDPHQLHKCRLYGLADRLLLPDLSKEVLLLYEACMSTKDVIYIFGRDEIEYIYKNTSELSSLRALVVKQFVKSFLHVNQVRSLSGWLKTLEGFTELHNKVTIGVRAHVDADGYT